VDEDSDTEKPEIALEIATAVRELGNKLFKEGKTEEALKKYEKSLRYLDVHPVLPEDSPAELKTAFDALLAPLLLNSALAAIKVQPKFTSNSVIAVTNTTRALNKLQLSDVDKAKALYRRALAHLAMDQEDKAEVDLSAAAQLAPNDANIANELKGIRQAKKDLKEKEKKAYKKFFA